MNQLNRLWQYGIAALLMMWLAAATFADTLNHPAQQQMQQNTRDVMAIINNQSLSQAQKIQRLNGYADRYLDYQRIAAASVGVQWKNFTPQQKQDFIAAYKELMISMYSSTALLAAQNAKVTVLPKHNSSNSATKAMVYTQIVNNKNKTFAVDYQMYKNGNVWKIYNINAEGVNVVATYRNQFNDILQKQGIDGLIQALRNKSIKKAS